MERGKRPSGVRATPSRATPTGCRWWSKRVRSHSCSRSRARRETPLPPYIRPEPGTEPFHRERYQTRFAAAPGAVAAPTAGLHFTDTVLERLQARGCEVARVTLHVGPDTFLPVRSDDITSHPGEAVSPRR